jgi:hypothetical protein
MATAAFAKTLENLQYSKRCIPESQQYFKTQPIKPTHGDMLNIKNGEPWFQD